MKEEQDYIRDIADMRSMMERSSKFLSLSGLAGIMAGIYALAGAFIAYSIFEFDPQQTGYANPATAKIPDELLKVIFLAILVLILAVGTAFFLSHKKAVKRHEKSWNPTTRRLLMHMAVPLLAGGLFVLVLMDKGLIGLIPSCTLIFYGLALYNAGKFTYEEVKSLGLVEIALGLISAYFDGYGLLFWALGFGVVHIIYGIYIHYRYER